MKKDRLLIVVLLLALQLVGCRAETAPEVTTEIPAATTAAETQASETEVPAQQPSKPPKEYDSTIAVPILVEGEPDKLIMDLFDGGNYVIYIPQNDWKLTTSLRDGFLRDRWSCQWADEVFLEVTSYGNLSEDEVLEQFKNIYGTVLPDDYEDGSYGIPDPTRKVYRSLVIHSDGKNTFSLMREMPVEFGDGFAPRFRAMEDSFEIK